MSAYIPVELRQQIHALDQHCCAYCQSAEALLGVTFEIEHIIPISLGGVTALSNLCLNCPSCNRYKSNRLRAHDAETDADAALFHPRQQEWRDHFVWIDEATRVKGLTQTGRATLTALQINRPVMVQLRRYWTVLHLHPPVW